MNCLSAGSEDLYLLSTDIFVRTPCGTYTSYLRNTQRVRVGMLSYHPCDTLLVMLYIVVGVLSMLLLYYSIAPGNAAVIGGRGIVIVAFSSAAAPGFVAVSQDVSPPTTSVAPLDCLSALFLGIAPGPTTACI